VRFEEFIAVPLDAVVEFRFPHHDETWRGWLVSGPYQVVCEGARTSTSCFVAHREPRAFDCVDIQLDPADWPYEEPPREDGEEYVRIPIVDVLGVHELPPERARPPQRKPPALRPEAAALPRHVIVIDEGRGLTPPAPGTPMLNNLQQVTSSIKLARRLRGVVRSVRWPRYR